MDGGPPTTLRRVVRSALIALTFGLAAIGLLDGFSPSVPLLRLAEVLAVFLAGLFLLLGAAMVVAIRLAGWREPASEREFEALVQRTEELAARGEWGAADDELPGAEADDELLDLSEEAHFRALVRAAVDELPLEFHRALEHVAIVVADGGRRRRAYGLYEGDTVARDGFHDRIVIFRDTLVRDFGHDPELLRAQITRTVRHELAHHLGWDERGVRRLGL